MTEAVLELKDVCFRWPNQNRATIDLPELKIDQGERIFLQGPSGSGKSTLLFHLKKTSCCHSVFPKNVL